MTVFLKRHENVRALILYLILISVFYAPVVFSGKSLQPSLYQPNGIVEGWPYGYKGRTPVNTFNIDLATPAYYEWPVNKLAGDIYRKGGLPLWNPYQGAGTPLAAQYSSRVFFPYQVMEDISPVWLWDYFLLGRLFIAGFFTFLFLRLLGLSFSPAFLGGVFYMFSGSFTWFINLEQFANNAMMLPLFLYSLERLIQESNGRNVALSGISFGLVLLAGQPEVALYVLFLGACYYVFRILVVYEDWNITKNLMRFVFVCILGLALAAPLILPFIEFMNHSHNIHPPGGDMGVRDPLTWERAFNFFTPTANELPQDPDHYLTVLFAREWTPDGKPYYFRFFPINGEWDFLGGYTGIIPVFLMMTAFFILIFKGSRWRSYFLVFLFTGLVIVLKNFGIQPFLSLGYLPLFDQVWSQRWAGPVWTFSFAAGGAVGFQIIKDYFSGEAVSAPQKGPEAGDIRNRLSQSIKKVSRVNFRIYIKYSIVHIAAAWSALAFAYSTYKEWMKYIAGNSLSFEARAAIKAVFPWAILVFLSGYLIVAGLKNKKAGFLSFKQYGVLLVIQAVLINLIFYGSGKDVLIAQNVSLFYLAAILYLGSFAMRVITVESWDSIVKHVKAGSTYSFMSNKFEWVRRPYPVFAFIIILSFYISLIPVSFNRYGYRELSFFVKPYFIPSVVFGISVTALMLIAATVICLYYIRTGKGLNGIVILGMLELWWAVPRGYDHTWLMLKTITLIIGIFIALAVVSEKWRLTVAGIFIFFMAFTLMDLKSPKGFPDRYNPFNNVPYAGFIKKQDGYYRVMGGYGILFPNFAGALRIQDIRYINALTPLELDYYRRKYLHVDEQGLVNSSVHWFTGRAEQYIREGKSTCEPLSYRPVEQDIKINIKYYSIMGVRYILMPSRIDFNYEWSPGIDPEQELYFPLIYDKEIRIYENPYALPRAFVAHSIIYAPAYKEAQEMLSEPDFDPAHEVVLEEKAPADYADDIPADPDAKVDIREYSLNKVIIDAQTEEPGVLVLSDIYYPGWKAYIDGKPAKIYRVDGIIRGVFVGKGRHLVEFRYLPLSFVIGCILSGMAVIGFVFLAVLSKEKNYYKKINNGQ